jgi:hypothetical protein
MRSVMLRFGRGMTRLFRANSGVGWVGKIIERTARTITLANPRAFHAMPSGTPDLIGWHSVIVTPEMVGARVALFVAIECKGSTTPTTPGQLAFLELVDHAGGIAVLAKDEGTVSAAFARRHSANSLNGPARSAAAGAAGR